MNNFWKRAITGTLFVVVMIGGIMWNYWSLFALFFIISMLGLNEFYGLVKQPGIQPQRLVGLIIGALFFLMVSNAYIFFYYQGLFFAAVVPLLLFVFFIELYRNQNNPFQNIAFTITGILYTVLPFALLVFYCSPRSTFFGDVAVPYNPHILLGYFFMLWTNDTGAYLTGRAFGRHKLWERISPKKTWEGFIGGIMLSIVAGYIISLFYKELNLVLWIIIALIVSIFGTLGDLVESMLKRSLNVKESGGILPGHGGILDRFDGVLLSAPLVIAMLYVLNLVHILLNS